MRLFLLLLYPDVLLAIDPLLELGQAVISEAWWVLQTVPPILWVALAVRGFLAWRRG